MQLDHFFFHIAPPLSPAVRNVLPITTAKVPIVKFYHAHTGLEGDISLYNTLVELFTLSGFPSIFNVKSTIK